MFSAFNTSKCTHTWSSGQPTLRRPESSWGFGALLNGLTSVMDNSCRSRDSNPQPRITSPTLYPLGHDCPGSWLFALLASGWHCRALGTRTSGARTVPSNKPSPSITVSITIVFLTAQCCLGHYAVKMFIMHFLVHKYIFIYTVGIHYTQFANTCT